MDYKNRMARTGYDVDISERNYKRPVEERYPKKR